MRIEVNPNGPRPTDDEQEVIDFMTATRVLLIVLRAQLTVPAEVEKAMRPFKPGPGCPFPMYGGNYDVR